MHLAVQLLAERLHHAGAEAPPCRALNRGAGLFNPGQAHPLFFFVDCPSDSTRPQAVSGFRSQDALPEFSCLRPCSANRAPRCRARPASRNSARSPGTAGGLTSRAPPPHWLQPLGAKAGKAIKEAPRSVNTARAEKDLNIMQLLTLFVRPDRYREFALPGRHHVGIHGRHHLGMPGRLHRNRHMVRFSTIATTSANCRHNRSAS